MRKKQSSRLLDPTIEAHKLLSLIHSYYKTADRYPHLAQLRYYGYTEYEANICIKWLQNKGLIVLDRESHITSHISPNTLKK